MARYCEICGKTLKRRDNTGKNAMQNMTLCRECRAVMADGESDAAALSAKAAAKEERAKIRAQREYARQTIERSPWRVDRDDNSQFDHDVFMDFKRRHEMAR